MNTAFVFPGQGSQYRGMIDDVICAHKSSKRFFDLASELAERDLLKMSRIGSDEDLLRTDICQLMVASVEIALHDALLRKGIKPSITAGHSMGECCAAMTAGCMDAEQCLELIWRRGSAMYKCALENEGAMMAVLGIKSSELKKLIEDMEVNNDIHIANFNSPLQSVLSGDEKLIEEFGQTLKENNVRFIKLNVRGAFHTKAMKDARETIKGYLGGISFKDPSINFVSGSGLEETRDAEAVKKALYEGITAPVYWWEVQKKIVDFKCDLQIEVGPGSVLNGIAKREIREIKYSNAFKVTDLESLSIK